MRPSRTAEEKKKKKKKKKPKVGDPISSPRIPRFDRSIDRTVESVGKKSDRQLSVSSSSSSSSSPRLSSTVARRSAGSRTIEADFNSCREFHVRTSRSIIVTQMRSERNPGPLMSTVRILGTPRTDSPLFVLLRCF